MSWQGWRLDQGHLNAISQSGERKGLLDHRAVVELVRQTGRRVTRHEQDGQSAPCNDFGDGADAVPAKVDVEHRKVVIGGLGQQASFANAAGLAGNAVAKLVDHAGEHHANKRLILDQQYRRGLHGFRPAHGQSTPGNSVRFRRFAHRRWEPFRDDVFAASEREMLGWAQRNRGCAVSTFRSAPIPLFAIMNLESQHNEAMRKEIGYRLGMFFSSKQASAPDRMLRLVDQLSRLDHDTAGADSLNPEVSIERTDAWLRAVFVQEEHHLRERLQDELNSFSRDELARLLAKIDDTLRGDLGSS